MPCVMRMLALIFISRPSDEKIYQGDANQGTGIIINTIENLISVILNITTGAINALEAHEDLASIYNLIMTKLCPK